MAANFVFYTKAVGSNGTLMASFTREVALAQTDASIHPGQQIGMFRMPFDQASYDDLVRRIKAMPEMRAGDSLPPGTATETIGIMDGGKAEAVHSYPIGAIPEPCRHAFERLDAAVGRVLENPHHALGGRASWERSSVPAGEPLVLHVHLKNVGVDALLISNPAAAASSEAIGISLVLVRAEAPAQSDRVTHTDFQPEEVSMLGPEGRPEKSPAATLQLAPGKELVLRLRTAARLVPAQYQAMLQVVTPKIGPDPAQGVSGSLEMELSPLAVVRPDGAANERPFSTLRGGRG